MKSPLFSLAAWAILTSTGWAQPATPPADVKPTPAEPVVEPAAVRAIVAQAKLFAQGSDATAAEEALTMLNVAKPETAEWHLETAQRLMQTAEQLARDGEPQNVAVLAARALQHLALADTRAKNAATRADAKTLAGFIYERYLADPAAALASYEQAAQLAPETAGKAKEASERLRKTDDNVKAKVAAGGK